MTQTDHDLAESYLSLQQSEQSARERWLNIFPTRSAIEVAQAAGYTEQDNQSAHCWKSACKIFGILVDNEERYPNFQFDETGQPLPVIEQVLAILGSARKPWSLAFWFVSGNGMLGGDCPLTRMRTDPTAVIAAATHEVAPRGD